MHLSNPVCLRKFSALLYCCFTLLFLLPARLRSQNLVPNPSFELANCPTGYNGFPSQVELYTQSWYAANCGSPDPMTNCSVNTGQAVNTSVPDVWFGTQYARTGTNYMGFGHYGFTEFLGTRLTSPLVAGEVYHVSFYVSCADYVQYASDALGMYFSATPVKASSGNCLTGAILNYTPQVVSTPGVFLTDYTGWMEVSGSYTALGGEEYIAIGCFVPFSASTMNHLLRFSNAADPTYVPTGSARLYYYIDDVSVEKTPLPVRLLSFLAETSEQKTILRWTSVEEEGLCQYEVQKSKDAVRFHTIDTMKPAGKMQNAYLYIDEQPFDETLYYRLKQVDCNGAETYSKTVKAPSRVELLVFPNPVVDQLQVSLPECLPPAAVRLYDLSGQPVYEKAFFTENILLIPYSDFPSGIYTLIIDLSDGRRLYRKIEKL